MGPYSNVQVKGEESFAAAVPDRVAPLGPIWPAVAAAAVGAGASAVSARPAASTATHKPPGRHDTPARAIPDGPSDGAQPGAGEPSWSDATASPWALTATHREPAVQEAPVRAPASDTGVALQVAAAAAGSVLASAWPASSTARQLPLGAHATAVVGGEGSMGLTRQTPVAGWLLTATSPPLLTAAHRASMHEIPDSEP